MSTVRKSQIDVNIKYVQNRVWNGYKTNLQIMYKNNKREYKASVTNVTD